MSCTGDSGRRELQITAYLDGELDLTSALELEEHLARCPDCARSLADQRALGQAIAVADLRFRPAPEQVERLRQRLAGGELRPADERSPAAQGAAGLGKALGPRRARGPAETAEPPETVDAPGTLRPAGSLALPGAFGPAAPAPREAPGPLAALGSPRAPGPPAVLGPSGAPGRRAAWARAWLSGPRLRAIAALLVVAVASWSAGRRWPASPDGAAGTRSRESRPAEQAATATAGPDDRLTEQVLAGHVRALLAGRPEDVATSDRHAIKPWFAGRLDYSPPVVDLAARGFLLRGGRLDYVGGRPVAALVYQAGNHLVSVFVWPAEAGAAASPSPASGSGAAPSPAAPSPAAPGSASGSAAAAASSSRRGFNQLRWTQGGMAWWAVSDVGADRLSDLVRELRAELAPAPAAISAPPPPLPPSR